MLAAATAGTALPGLVALSSQGLTAGGVALSLVGSAGGVAAGVLTGRMGNVLHDRMKDGVADPRALLRNHHLHRLTAESAKSVLLASQSEMLSRSDKEHLPRLAAAVVSEWDELADTKGFQEPSLASLATTSKPGSVPASATRPFPTRPGHSPLTPGRSC